MSQLVDFCNYSGKLKKWKMCWMPIYYKKHFFPFLVMTVIYNINNFDTFVTEYLKFLSYLHYFHSIITKLAEYFQDFLSSANFSLYFADEHSHIVRLLYFVCLFSEPYFLLDFMSFFQVLNCQVDTFALFWSNIF